MIVGMGCVKWLWAGEVVGWNGHGNCEEGGEGG